MSKLFFLFLTFYVFTACTGQNTQQGTAPIDAMWAMDPLWDDGKAEVATYRATRVVYGKPRQFEWTFITVKEDFNEEFNTKTDDYERSDLFPVMKVNKFARIPTDNYPYHYLTSLFYRRETPAELHKMTASSQEWCGNTFKLFEQQGKGYQYRWSSYWDRQGEGERKLDETPAPWFEDGLSHTLRALQFSEGLQFEQPVLESQISNKAPVPTIYRARLQVTTDQLQGKEVWKVAVQLEAEKENVYWFAKEYPNTLQRTQTWDGQLLELTALEREAYWQ